MCHNCALRNIFTYLANQATEKCRWILIYDKAYFISVHLLVSYVSVNIDNVFSCICSGEGASSESCSPVSLYFIQWNTSRMACIRAEFVLTRPYCYTVYEHANRWVVLSSTANGCPVPVDNARYTSAWWVSAIRGSSPRGVGDIKHTKW